LNVSVISSSPDGRKRKPRDPRGNEHGVIEPAPEGGNLDRDCLISIRWVQQAIENSARDLASPWAQEEPADGDDYAELMDDHARSLEHAAALWRAFRLLWRATDHRVTAGAVIDCADLYVSGHGTIEEIVAGLVAGKFDDLPRDRDGFIRGCWPGLNAE
jgi:hypothetical protein